MPKKKPTAKAKTRTAKQPAPKTKAKPKTTKELLEHERLLKKARRDPKSFTNEADRRALVTFNHKLARDDAEGRGVVLSKWERRSLARLREDERCATLLKENNEPGAYVEKDNAPDALGKSKWALGHAPGYLFNERSDLAFGDYANGVKPMEKWKGDGNPIKLAFQRTLKQAVRNQRIETFETDYDEGLQGQKTVIPLDVLRLARDERFELRKPFSTFLDKNDRAADDLAGTAASSKESSDGEVSDQDAAPQEPETDTTVTEPVFSEHPETDTVVKFWYEGKKLHVSTAVNGQPKGHAVFKPNKEGPTFRIKLLHCLATGKATVGEPQECTGVHIVGDTYGRDDIREGLAKRLSQLTRLIQKDLQKGGVNPSILSILQERVIAHPPFAMTLSVKAVERSKEFTVHREFVVHRSSPA